MSYRVSSERHTLGLSLAELVVASSGWRPLWVGEGPPADEIGALLKKLKPAALVVAASAVSRPAAVASYQTVLTEHAKIQGLRLILAGSGAWKDAGAAKRILTFKELREVLL